MSELPKGWSSVAISEIAIYNPKTVAPENTECAFSPMQYLGTNFRSQLGFEVKTWGDIKKAYTHFQNGDVLVAKVTPCFENGKAGIASDLPSGIGAGSSEFMVFRSTEAILNRFLLGWLSTQDFRRRATVAMTGSVGLKRVPKDFVLAEQIPLAPFPEQKRIADKLDATLARVDACRERLARVAPILKRFRQSVLAAATSGQLTADWRELQGYGHAGDADRYDEGSATLAAHDERGAGLPLSQEFMEIRLRLSNQLRGKRLVEIMNLFNQIDTDESIPLGWLCCPVGVIGDVSNGSTPSRAEISFWNGDIPWVSSGEVRNNLINSTREGITQLGFDSSSVKLLPAGTVLIAMIGEGKTRGQSAILRLRATINQNIAAVTPFSEVITSEYLWYYFQAKYEENRTAGGGTGPQALNCQRVREFMINLPPLTEQTEIVRRVETLFAFADRLEARLASATAAAERLTPSLLAKAFRGELVPQDPNDEPASELLKRLAASRESAGKAPKAKRSRKPAAA